MIVKVYSVFDNKAGMYMPPFYMRSAGEATRAFAGSINDKNDTNVSQMAQTPEDFTLFELASFNDETAQFSVLDSPKSLGNGLEYKEE